MMSTPPEEWRSVVGSDAYEVSNHGRVRSIARVLTYRRADQYSGRTITVRRRHAAQLLRPGPTSTGHLTVSLGRGRVVLVHHLVLEAFVGPRPPKPFEGLHADDVPSNNFLENLRWGTRSANIHDAIRNGGRQIGQRSYNAKLRDTDIPAIRSLFGRVSFAELGRRYGVAESTIRQIKSGKSWAHIEGAVQCATF